MNIYAFSGNLGADPQLRYTSSQKAVCSFNVGVSSGYGEQRKTIWVRCQLWEKQAELAAEAFKKGMRFNGCGEITSNSYEKDGVEKPQLEVRVTSFDLPPRTGESVSVQRQHLQPNDKKENFDDFEDDIPFN